MSKSGRTNPKSSTSEGLGGHLKTKAFVLRTWLSFTKSTLFSFDSGLVGRPLKCAYVAFSHARESRRRLSRRYQLIKSMEQFCNKMSNVRHVCSQRELIRAIRNAEDVCPPSTGKKKKTL